jgi:hypothetical protein
MVNAVFGYNNLIESGTLVAGSEAAGLPISQVRVPQGSSASSWQTATGVKTAAAGAWFTVDMGSDATWQAFLLARTSLTSAAQVRWRVGEPTGWTEVASSFDLDLTTSPAMTGWSGTRAGAGTGEATFINSSGNLATATASQFRFTHDPETLEPLGLLWEPARTNSVRNPRLVGAAVKTTGTMPTNWAVGDALTASLPAGVEFSVFGGGVETFNYIDVRFFGTPTDVNPVIRIKPEINADGVTPTIVASVGQAWTFQCRVRGSTTMTTTATPPCTVGIDEYNGTTFLAGSSTAVPAYGSSGATFTGTVRTHARTLTQATTNGIIPYIQYQLTQGVPCDFIVRFGDPRALRSAVNYVTNPVGATGRVNGLNAGTNPTRAGWNSVTGFNPILVGIGTENGMAYVDYRVVCNPTADITNIFYAETGNTAAATLGTPWAVSAFAKYVGTPAPAASLHQIVLLELTAGGVIKGEQRTAVTDVRASTTPLTACRTGASFNVIDINGGTATGFVRGGFAFTFPAGPVDTIIRFAAPQVENGPSITFPMLQSGTGTTLTTTRPTDASLRTITALSNYSVYVEGMVMGATATDTVDRSLGLVTVYAAGSTNGYLLGPTRVAATGQINSHGNAYNPSITFGGFNGGGAINVGEVFRLAVGYTAASQGAGANGVANTFISSPGTHTATLDRMSLSTTIYGSICYRKIRLFASRLSDGRLWSGLAATGTTMNLSAVTYDSGWGSAGVQPGYGQSFRFSPTPAVGQYAYCEIDDPTNPDGFVAVGLAYAGPVWQPALNIGWETATNTDTRVDEVVTRGGQEYPQYRYEQRRWDVSMQHILDSEIWSEAAEVQRAGRRGGNVLFVPDPVGDNMQKEAVFGRVYSQSDIEYSNNTTQYRSWRLRVIERL